MTIRSERLSFPSAVGDRLAARLDWPERPPLAFALFAHCFTCSKDILAATRIARALTAHGVAVLRFDFTGLGASEGEFANAGFSSNIADLVAAADHLRRHHAAPAMLIGHSLGGAAVLAAARQIPEARVVATIGAPFGPQHLRQRFTEAEDEIRARGSAAVEIGGRPFRVSRQFLEDIEGHRMAEAIADMRKALLVFHAPRDEIVGIDNASQIFLAARHPKSFVSLDDADHLLTRAADAVYVARVVAAWASRYLGPAEAADETDVRPGAAPAAVEPGEVVVAEADSGRFAQTVLAGRHRLIADEPQSVGGDDSGPSPYDFLLAALGTCTSMTLRMYATQKQWPLEKVTVRLSHGKIHAVDCADCETREGKIDRIDRRIAIAGPLTEDQRRRLLEIADRCPVHRTLHSEIKIVTSAEG